MAKNKRYNKNYTSPVQITDELYSNVGSAAFILGDIQRAFKGSTDFVLRTASGGGGTLLIENTDYTLQIDSTLSAEAGYNVYKTCTITNASYQTGNLYFTYKLVGSYTDALNFLDVYSMGSSHYGNLFRNPRGLIAQRGDGPFTTNGYDIDGEGSMGNGTTFSVTKTAFTVGQVLVPYNPKHRRQIVVTSSAGAGNYYYRFLRIEDVTKFAGETATISFYASDSVGGKPVAVSIHQNFGTGGSPSAQVDTHITKFTLTNADAPYSQPFTVPSVLGKTLGLNNNDYIEIRVWMDAGSTYNTITGSLGQQSGTFYLSDLCLNHGNVAMPAKNWIKSEQEWLAENQRYLVGGSNHWGQFNQIRISQYDYNTLYFIIAMPTDLRALPNLINVVEGTDFNVSSVMTGAPITGFAMALHSTTGTNYFLIKLTKTTHGLTDGVLNLVNTFFSAEL